MRLGRLRRNPTRKNGEEGYFLIVIMIMVALIAMASLAHVQNVVTQLKHDQEEELVHRGAQYARAIKKFQKKMGTPPVSIEQLEKTNNIRFLRKRYKDPITGGDFRLVRGTEIANIMNSAQGSGGSNNSGMNGPVANTVFNAVGLGGGATSPTSGNTGAGSTGFGQPIGGSGPTFGGGPIIGVASTSPKKSLMEFNGKNHYKDWYFVYLPQFDLCGAAGNAGIAAVAGVAATAVAGPRPITCPLIKGPFVASRGGANSGIPGATSISNMTWGSGAQNSGSGNSSQGSFNSGPSNPKQP